MCEWSQREVLGGGNIELLRPRHTSQEDAEPEDAPVLYSGTSELNRARESSDVSGPSEQLSERNPTTAQTYL